MGDGGKGSAPRPLGVNWEEFDKAWDSIFGKKKPCETGSQCIGGKCPECEPEKVRVSGVPYEVELKEKK